MYMLLVQFIIILKKRLYCHKKCKIAYGKKCLYDVHITNHSIQSTITLKKMYVYVIIGTVSLNLVKHNLYLALIKRFIINFFLICSFLIRLVL